MFVEQQEQEEFESYISTEAAEFHLRVIEADCKACGVRSSGTAVILERNGWKLATPQLCPRHHVRVKDFAVGQEFKIKVDHYKKCRFVVESVRDNYVNCFDQNESGNHKGKISYTFTQTNLDSFSSRRELEITQPTNVADIRHAMRLADRAVENTPFGQPIAFEDFVDETVKEAA